MKDVAMKRENLWLGLDSRYVPGSSLVHRPTSCWLSSQEEGDQGAKDQNNSCHLLSGHLCARHHAYHSVCSGSRTQVMTATRREERETRRASVTCPRSSHHWAEIWTQAVSPKNLCMIILLHIPCWYPRYLDSTCFSLRLEPLALHLGTWKEF